MPDKWNKYSLTFEALSPVSIGYNTLGFVKLTRHYIPAKNLWGSTVKYLTEARCDDCKRDNYQNIEDFIWKNIRFGYFFVKFNDCLYKPTFSKEKGLEYGGVSLEDFQSKFIYCSGSTAIDPLNAAAEEKTLHEIEYINWCREEQKNGRTELLPVEFEGNIWIKKEINSELPELKNLCDTLKKLYENISLGGQISTGFGRLKLTEWKDEGEKDFEVVEVDRENHLIVKIDEFLNNSEYLETHMEFDKKIKFEGTLEPVVGREWARNKADDSKYGAGRQISKGTVCLTPGTKISNKPEKVILSSYGIISNLDS